MLAEMVEVMVGGRSVIPSLTEDIFSLAVLARALENEMIGQMTIVLGKVELPKQFCVSLLELSGAVAHSDENVLAVTSSSQSVVATTLLKSHVFVMSFNFLSLRGIPFDVCESSISTFMSTISQSMSGITSASIDIAWS